VFADMKEKHGLRWTAYRWLEKVLMQTMLVCAAMIKALHFFIY
jgi:hypothetical protein